MQPITPVEPTSPTSPQWEKVPTAPKMKLRTIQDVEKARQEKSKTLVHYPQNPPQDTIESMKGK